MEYQGQPKKITAQDEGMVKKCPCDLLIKIKRNSRHEKDAPCPPPPPQKKPKTKQTHKQCLFQEFLSNSHCPTHHTPITIGSLQNEDRVNLHLYRLIKSEVYSISFHK